MSDNVKNEMPKKMLSAWGSDTPEWPKLMQVFSEILWTANSQGIIEYFNEQWFTYTGAKHREQSKSIYNFLHQDDIQVFKKAWKNSLRILKPFEVQVRLKNKRNLYRWFMFRANPIKLESSGKCRWFGVGVDINEQKSLVQRLDKSERRFRSLFEQSPISTQIFSKDGKTIKVNKAWKHLWGRDMDDLLNYNVLKDQQLVDKGINPFIKKGFQGRHTKIPAIKYEINKTLPEATLKKQYCWVQAHIYPIKDENGEIDEVVLMHEDITGRKNIEDILLQANQMLYAIIKASPLAIYVVDLNNTVKVWNKAAEKIFGWNEKEVINKKLPSVSPDKLEELKMLKERIINGETCNLETTRVRRDASKIEVSISAAPLYDSGNEVSDIIVITADITERREIEKRKDDFISIASHELKTPVTSMKVFLQILKSRLEKNNSSKESLYFISKMESQLDKLNKLIRDLLDISRLSHGKLELNYESFNIVDLVNDIVENISAITPTHQITIKSKATIPVVADKERTGQVLINLITNAVKYSPLANEVIISIQKNESCVKVSVQDFGIGIEDKYKNRIFSQFYQIADREVRTFPGLGIGLYICDEIIQRHGGKIWCESIVGNGSTFYFTLPLTQAIQKS